MGDAKGLARSGDPVRVPHPHQGQLPVWPALANCPMRPLYFQGGHGAGRTETEDPVVTEDETELLKLGWGPAHSNSP